MIPISKKHSNTIFERKKYLDELIAGRGNGLVKIITGVRRCGKSFLLFDIWHNWLLEHGVTDSHIIEIQLDDFRNRRLRKPDALLDYIDSKVVDDGEGYLSGCWRCVPATGLHGCVPCCGWQNLSVCDSTAFATTSSGQGFFEGSWGCQTYVRPNIRQAI